LIVLVRIEKKFESTKTIYTNRFTCQENLRFVLAQQIFCELQVLIYDAAGIKLIIIVFKFKQLYFLSTWKSKRKALYFNGFAVYGEQIEPSTIFVASFSHELIFSVQLLSNNCSTCLALYLQDHSS